MLTTRRHPRTLQAEAEQHANAVHTARMDELRKLAPLLAQLDALREPLENAGLVLHPDRLSLRLVSLSGTIWTAKRNKVLSIYGGSFVRNSQSPSWHTALVDLGFRTLRHNAGSAFPTALMRKGTLLIEVDLSGAESAALAPAALTVQPRSEYA